MNTKIRGRMISLAFRNLWRNPKRSAITISAIVVGVWGLIFLWAFIDGINEQMIVNNIQYLTGHIKVHRAGFHEDRVLALSMDREPPPALEPDGPIRAIAPRVEGFGLISRENFSDTIQVFGVDPDQEKTVTSLHRTLVEGSYLSAGPRGIVIGDSLAHDLNIELGDELDIIVQAADGSLGADRFVLAGIYDSGIDQLDQKLVLMPIESARELYSMWNRTTSWVVRLENRLYVDDVAQEIERSLTSDFEVYTWKRLLPGVVDSIAFHETVGYIVLLVVFVVVAAGIANTLLMAVMERRREFGVMQALGTDADRIVGIVLCESFLLALIGLAIGNIVGVAFTAYWARVGLDLSAYTHAMETMPGLSGIVYPLVRLDHLVMISSFVFAVCLVPALPPVWRVSRLSPVEAMQGEFDVGRTSARMERTIRFPPALIWWQLAWRNLFRNPKRSLITGGATAFGMAAFVFLYAFVDGFFEQMTTNSTDLFTSHLQISVRNAGREEIPFRQSEITFVADTERGIEATSPRIVRSVVISSARQALPVEWFGVVPEREVRVTRLHELIEKGTYVEEPGAVVIGRKLAEELEVEVGNKVIVTGQQRDGSLASAALRVSGIFRSGSELYDLGYAVSDVQDLRTLHDLDVDQITHLALRLDDRSESVATAETMRIQLPDAYDARPWERLLPIVTQMIEMARLDFYLVLAVIFIVVAIGVMNTMLMSVLERVREFGLQLALGTEPVRLLLIVLYESVILGAIGVLVGAAVGLGIAQYYHVQGIDLSAFTAGMAAIPGLTDRVSPEIILSHLWLPGVLLYLVSVLASIYPALKAASLEPVEALHAS